jgi:hypothetical protein
VANGRSHAATRLEVREERKIENGIIRGMIGGHEHLIRYALHSFDHVLDQRAANKTFESFILSHARRLTDRLNNNL